MSDKKKSSIDSEAIRAAMEVAINGVMHFADVEEDEAIMKRNLTVLGKPFETLGDDAQKAFAASQERIEALDSVLKRDAGGEGYANLPYLIEQPDGTEIFIPSSKGIFIPDAAETIQRLEDMESGGFVYFKGVTIDTSRREDSDRDDAPPDDESEDDK